MIDLTQQQTDALDVMQDWFADPDCWKKPFVLSGYAGTGKSTLVSYLISPDILNLKPSTEYLAAAYTGKAALVMQKMGVPASTCHSLTYKAVPPDKAAIASLKKQIAEFKVDTSNTNSLSDLRKELADINKLRFVLNPESPLHNAELLVLDECSMINTDLKSDIMSFKVPIIALGDPGQLPPIEGTGAMFENGHDALLTEIHRQAADNPIIAMSVRAREGIPIPYSDDPRARHIRSHELTDEDLLAADQIITGKHVTRRKMNERLRILKFEGHPDFYPMVGDKLVCLRNEKEEQLFNGLMCEVVRVIDLYDDWIELEIQTELRPDHTQLVRALRPHFDAYVDPKATEPERFSFYDRKRGHEFDYGYCLTVHKFQGSQCENLVFLDDGMYNWGRKFAEQRRQWLYTGITRAAETLTLVSA